jgi:hypothetical protein
VGGAFDQGHYFTFASGTGSVLNLTKNDRTLIDFRHLTISTDTDIISFHSYYYLRILVKSMILIISTFCLDVFVLVNIMIPYFTFFF